MAAEVTWQSHPPERLLRERFDITTGFHPGQRGIIEQLVHGKRLLVIQRTGWGKSLCYQMASLYYPHLTIVFSPLKALMRDQCQHCNDLYNIPAAIVSSDFSQEKNRATLAQAVEGRFKILFIAPERLDNADWQASMLKMRISMIVVDEAHCISTWGHDFRPHYRRIVRLLAVLPKHTPILALTATANERVEQDVLQQIGAAAQVIRGTLQRPNLYVNVVQLQGEQEKLSYLASVLPWAPGTGIIYTATKHDAEMVATFLNSQYILSEYYHAGREDAVRQEIEQKLLGNHYKVVCSTNALGMGIDKPDVRFIIHYHLPASPIHYYQEIGRAGRDGSVAWCILLYDAEDLAIQEHFIRNARPEEMCYETVLSLLRLSPHQDLYDIMLVTGFSEKAVQIILAHLEEQYFVRYNARDRTYSAIYRLGQIDFSASDTVRLQKQRELCAMQHYVQTAGCYMGHLITYLGDQADYRCGACGHCNEANFPSVIPSERLQVAAVRFLEDEFLPRIERYSIEEGLVHEAGWAISYHGKSRVGKLVRFSKYKDGGPFALGLVFRATEVARTRYPVNAIDGIVSVPPTKSGELVEMFARQVAAQLGIEYLLVLAKRYTTRVQKEFTNRVQKVDNVKGAFVVCCPELVAGRSLLLIDDIYDSGCTLREVAQTLMQAGARAVYPLTITRTVHSDDQ